MVFINYMSAGIDQDMWHGRDRQSSNSGSPRARHRSDSRRLSARPRPVKSVARKDALCPGALREGDSVRVFCRSVAEWVDGQIMKFVEDSFVRVEYDVGEERHGKIMHLHSDHLVIPLRMFDSSGAAYTPKTITVGDCVSIFCPSARAWIDGEVASFVDGKVRVEYLAGLADGLVEVRYEDCAFCCHVKHPDLAQAKICILLAERIL